MSLSPTSLSLAVGGAAGALSATVSPSDATDDSVTWSTSAASVATVSTTGVVSPVAVGSATITVTTVDGGKTEVCSVTVARATPSILIGAQSNAITTEVTGHATFAVTTTNVTNGTAGSLSWCSSSGSALPSIPTGLTYSVTPVASGSATLTISTNGSSAQGSCYFKLIEGSATSSLAALAVTWYHVISPQGVTIVAGTGGSATFTVPKCAVPSDCNITWCSSDGSALSSIPTGLTNALPHVTAEIGYITIIADTSASAGTYYFKLTNGSAVATFTISAGP